MANRTIAPGGGNINVAATFVEVAVPTSADVIIGNTASGQLTVNVNTIVQSVNFTGYVALLTINDNIVLQLNLAASTSTFSAAGTYSFLGSGTTQGRIQKIPAMTINMLGTTPIPCFQNGATGVLTAASDLYFTNLLSTTTQTIINGLFNCYISGNILGAGTEDPRNRGVSGTIIYNMVGTGDLFCCLGVLNNTATLIINTAGTITIRAFLALQNGGLGTLNSNIIFTHTSGTIINPTFRAVPASTISATSTTSLNLISGTTWDLFISSQFANAFNQFTISGTPQLNNFTIDSQTSATTFTLPISGSNIVCNNLYLNTSIITDTTPTPFDSLVSTSIDLVLSPTQSLTVNGSLVINGGTNQPVAAQTPPVEIRSLLPGTQSSIILNTFTQSVSRARFTDIAVSSNTLYGQGLTLSNTTNIQNYTLPPSGGGGGGGGSFVYLT